MKKETSIKSQYPLPLQVKKVGTYPALTKSGGGYFYDEVLEYRVWVHPENGSDYFHAFSTCEDAQEFSESQKGAENPLVLVLQKEWIDEPEPDTFIHKKGKRITEWQIAWLADSKRDRLSIEEFIREKKG